MGKAIRVSQAHVNSFRLSRHCLLSPATVESRKTGISRSVPASKLRFIKVMA